VGSDVTPLTLAAMYQRNPGAEAKALLGFYIGKWIDVTGLVSHIDLSDGPQWFCRFFLSEKRRQALRFYFISPTRGGIACP
jgi:hypothetical protein